MKNQNKISSFWYDDQKLFIICIVMAALIWTTIRMTKDYNVNVQIPIRFIQSDSMTYVEQPIEFITYQLEGRGWDLLAMKSKKEYLKDTIVFKLDESNTISIPERRLLSYMNDNTGSLEIKEVIPSNAVIKQAPAHIKKIPLIVPIKVNIEQGYMLVDKLETSPDSILLKGPIAEIEQFNSWIMDSIKTEPLSESTQLNIKINQPKKAVVKLKPESVNVEINIEKYTQHSFYIPIEIKNAHNDNISIFPSRIQIKFKVPISKYEKVRPEDFVAIVNMNQRIPNTNNIIIDIIAKPSYISELNFNPKIVEFFVNNTDL